MSRTNKQMKANPVRNKAVFFDRDNTLIEDKIYLNDPDQIHYLPGTGECLKRLSQAGYKLIIVTNQSGVPRGLVQLKNLHEIHRRMRDHFARQAIFISGFYYAPFLPASHHPMRKPGTGMLREAAFDHAIDLKNSWMVGDRMTDVEAGHRAGTRSIFYKITAEENPFPSQYDPPEAITDRLIEIPDIILGHSEVPTT